ncbi:uncharacterized protein LOC107648704, partial [Arachis ipaensis]|uniref:uncharacterized protein LOC107648704 n=1 Tax=Arachis ipaensis TaxID=130454 RepID=UPI0007AFD151
TIKWVLWGVGAERKFFLPWHVKEYHQAGRGGEEDDHPHLHDSSSDDAAAAHHDAVAAEPSAASHPSLGDRSIFDRPQPSSASGLPSAFDAFSELFMFKMLLDGLN